MSARYQRKVLRWARWGCIGKLSDREVREISQSLMIAWGEATIKNKQYSTYGSTNTVDGTGAEVKPSIPSRPVPLSDFVSVLQRTEHISGRTKNLCRLVS